MDAIAADYSSASSGESEHNKNEASVRDEETSDSARYKQTTDDDGFEVVRVTEEDLYNDESQALEKWVREAIACRESGGVKLNEEVRRNRKFRNPTILQKMIAYCEIDEQASNLPRTKVNEGDYYDAIAERQRRIADSK